MPFTFKVGESIKKGWSLYKENLGNILLFTFILIIIQVISQALSKNNNIFISLIFIIISFFISYIFIKANMNMIDGKGFKPFSKESLPSLASYWDFVKTNILMVLCVMPVFIIPVLIIVLEVTTGNVDKTLPLYAIPLFFVAFIFGIFISVRLFLSVYLSVEKNQGAVNSIKESWNATRGNVWTIVWKTFLIGLFAIAGLLALIIGIFITYPISMMLMIMLYRSLVSPSVTPEMGTAPLIPSVEKPTEQVEIRTETTQQ